MGGSGGGMAVKGGWQWRGDGSGGGMAVEGVGGSGGGMAVEGGWQWRSVVVPTVCVLLILQYTGNLCTVISICRLHKG